MDDDTGRCSRILTATFYLSLISLLAGCSNKLSQQENQTTIGKNDSASVKKEIIPGRAISYDSSKRYIYLTLDDGLQPGTMNCYRVLKDLSVKASFFMIGTHGMEHGEQLEVDSIRRAYPAFLLCNHTFTHAYFNKYKAFYGKPDAALLDLNKAQDSLRMPLKIFRTPANNSWAINGKYRSPRLTRAFCMAADSIGYKGIGWDLAWDFKGRATPVQGADEMFREVNHAFDHNEAFTKKHIVILAHDRMFEKRQYVDSLTKFIALLKRDSRNVFETIDHYPGVASNN
jgi:peptidoglycan/xylan/chitin deacetylase (PgdA/CDA1 family)